MNNILLIGLSGCGKSTLAREVGEKLGMTVADMDQMIEAETGTPIRTIFETRGEEHFRELETEAARRVAAMKNTVVATGGGVVTRRETVELLRRAGTVVFVDRPVEQIAADIECGHRPLLADGVEKLYEMAEARRPLYLDAADLIFPNDGPREGAADRLVAAIRQGLPRNAYAVIGDPVGHSLSPRVHGAVFDALGLRERYLSFHVPRGAAGWFAQRAGEWGVKGFNITAPHKQDIIPFLDGIEEEARLCGAVNTVVARDGKLCGCNTDMDGLHLSVQSMGYHYRGSRIVLLGAGGAAVGAALKAAREGAASVAILARRPVAAEEMAGRVRQAAPGSNVQTGGLLPEDQREAARGCDILINTVPSGSGMELPLPLLEALPAGALVCDMAYSPPRTPLLAEAEKRGHPILNGLGMLIYQAILSDQHYLNTTLDKRAMYDAALRSVSGYAEKERQ